MRLSLSCHGIVVALALCSLCCSTGCRTGAWGMPAANTSWLSWKNWGWNKSAGTDGAALASKPTTTAPKPSSTATPQPTTSIAAGTGASGSSVAAANATYPTTSQGYASPYATQAASAYQQPGATGQVQPSVGYQTGPYNVNAPAGATTAGGSYGQPATGGSYNQDSSGGYAAQSYGGQSYGATNQGSGSYATAAPAGDYRAADSRSMYGTQEASPYATDPQQGGYGAGSGGYNQPASGGYGAPSSTAPAPSTNPWNSYQAPPPNTYGAATQPAAGYGAAATTAPATQPAAAPGTSGYPALPGNLATSTGSYRPGSTAAASEGVQNAAYTQPSASGPAASGTINYGNSYLR